MRKLFTGFGAALDLIGRTEARGDGKNHEIMTENMLLILFFSQFHISEKKIQITGTKHFHEVLRDAFVNGHADVGKSLLKNGQGTREKVGRVKVGRSDGKVSVLHVIDPVYIVFQTVLQADDLLVGSDVLFPELRQGYG